MKRRTAIVRPLLLAGLLAIGAGVVLAVAWMWSFEFVAKWRWATRPYEYLVVRSDGTPLIASRAAYGEQILRTLDGAEVSDEEPVTIMGANVAAPPRDNAAMSPLTWEQRILSFVAHERRPAVFWYFIHDGWRDGSGYFVGYDAQSKARVGYIAIGGFRPDEPPAADRMPVDGRSFADGSAIATASQQPYAYEPYDNRGTLTVYVASGNRILEVDFRERSVRTLLETDPILGLSMCSRPEPPPANTSDRATRQWGMFLVARTPDRMVVADLAGQVRRSYALPERLRKKRFTFWELSDGTALIDRAHRSWDLTRHELLWIDTQGKIVEQREAALAGGMMTSPAGSAWQTAAVPVPLVAAVVTPMAAGETELDYEDREFLRTYRTGLPHAWPALTAVVLVGAALAALCYRRQVRYAQPWTAVWVIFVFLGGVPGLIGYLFHRRWPVRAACPACGAVAPRDRDACARCRTEFPAPEPKGTEVFAA